MSEIKTYTCDICKEVKHTQSLYTMSLNLVGPLNPGVGQYRRSSNHTKHACKDCLNKVELDMPSDNMVLTEDSLVDLLREFIVETTEDN